MGDEKATKKNDGRKRTSEKGKRNEFGMIGCRHDFQGWDIFMFLIWDMSFYFPHLPVKGWSAVYSY